MDLTEIAILLAILIGIVLAWLLRQASVHGEAALAARGLPADATTVAQDLRADPRWPGPQSLADPSLRVRGTIDHLLRDARGALLISELKTGARLPDHPRERDEIQLGTYFLLCARDATIGEEPAYGLLTYRTPDEQVRTFQIHNTPRLRERVLALIRHLREADATTARPSRSHDHPGRCRGCVWAAVCDERLG